MENKKEIILVEKERIVYQDYLTIRKRYLVDSNGNEFTRESLLKSESTAVLVYNIETNKIIFTNQYRDSISGMSLEIPAGVMDKKDLDPKDCAVREVLEEIGYKIDPLDLVLLVRTYPSVGYTNELTNIYLSVVSNKNKVNNGGGLKQENEYIEIVELDINEAFNKMKCGELMDSKSIIALQSFKNGNI